MEITGKWIKILGIVAVLLSLFSIYGFYVFGGFHFYEIAQMRDYVNGILLWGFIPFIISIIIFMVFTTLALAKLLEKK